MKLLPSTISFFLYTSKLVTSFKGIDPYLEQNLVFHAPYHLVENVEVKDGQSLASDINMKKIPVNTMSRFRGPILEGTERFQPIGDQNVADRCVTIPSCDNQTKFRTSDGSCNNLNFPMWGRANTALVRVLSAGYQDHVQQPRLAKNGKPLTKSRTIRTTLFPEVKFIDPVHTYNLMQWGQIVAHDVAHDTKKKEGLNCCGADNQLPHNIDASVCQVLEIPKGDKNYARFNVSCLSMPRAATTLEQLGCPLESSQQMDGAVEDNFGINDDTTDVTHFIDGSFLYGSNEEESRKIRVFDGGRLKSQITDDGIFPPNIDSPTKHCDVRSDEDICYMGGDSRINQNPGVTALHVLMLREHNRVCGELAALNPHWGDEVLYQETKRIVAAIIQRITYTQFLVPVLGEQFMKAKHMSDEKEGFSFDYDEFMNPSTMNVFTAAAYRSFHSLVPHNIIFHNESRCAVKSILLSDWFNKPSLIQEPSHLDLFLRGMSTQPQMFLDRFFTTELSNKLFKRSKPWGSDLIAIDIERGRDHGLPPYNAFRVACGLPRADTFIQFADTIPLKSIQALKRVYSDVDDVEVYVGGVLENIVRGTLCGPTFRCIMGEQFMRWRNGDRHYYKFGNQAGSFNLEQLKQIEKVTLSTLICQHGNSIKRMQRNAFMKHGPKNELVPCSVIDKMDLAFWKENQ